MLVQALTSTVGITGSDLVASAFTMTPNCSAPITGVLLQEPGGTLPLSGLGLGGVES